MVEHDYQSNEPNLEKEYWKQLAHFYRVKVRELENKVDTLNSEITLFEQKLKSLTQLSHKGIAIQNLKVNNIQSGAAFNIAEKLICSTKSDMDMDLGPNSMNIGDFNKMATRIKEKLSYYLLKKYK